MLQELETQLAERLLPMQDEGYRVLGAPTDHQQVGRVFGNGEIRVAYQRRTYQNPSSKIERSRKTYPVRLTFEVVVELQDVQMDTHGRAAQAMERILDLLAGFVPEGQCGGGFYPIQDGFVGRSKEDALWIYSAVFGIDQYLTIRRTA